MFKNLVIIAIVISASLANAETPETAAGVETKTDVIGTIKTTTEAEQKAAHKVIKKKKKKAQKQVK